MAKNKSVFGIYSTRESVEKAIEALKSAGFENTDISILFSENLGPKDLGIRKRTKAPEDAATGAGTGIVIGGILGWLAGIGALVIPGVGPFIAAGPLMATLAGAGVGGIIGEIAGTLVGMGIPEYEAKRYEGHIRKGKVLLSVHSDSSEERDRAKEIMERTGAEDISTSKESEVHRAEGERPKSRPATAEEASR